MDNKVYDQREDLHELKKFKNDMTSNSDLLSCPFCGRAARFDVVPCEDGIANAGGEYVSMNSKNLICGKSYRHKDHPDYCWAKVIKVLKPKEDENTTTRIVVKCEYSTQKDGTFGVVKYFKPSDLVEES